MFGVGLVQVWGQNYLELVRDNFCGSTGGKTPPLRVIGDS